MNPVCSRLTRVLFFLTAAVITVTATGCGGSGGSASNSSAVLSGTVKVNGKPLGYGRVELHFPGGRIAKYALGPDGTYKMSNLPTGPAKVVVIAGEPPVAAAAAGAAAPPPKFERVNFPDKYSDPEKTPLSYTVTPGTQTYDVIIEG